jgi:hypothetical protein
VSRLRESRPPVRPRLVVSNAGVQLPLPLVDQALPLARQLRLMAAAYGPASTDIADELIELLEGPKRPRRAA